MSLNWKEIELLILELAPRLEGSRVQKIAQIEQLGGGESFLLQGFSQKFGPYKLWISLFQDKTCFACLPEDEKLESAKEPSTFVMVLRKHLLGQEITKIEQVAHDRILFLHFGNGKSLYISLIPRRGNMALLENFDIKKHEAKCVSSFQKISLKPGAIYELPKAPAQVSKAELRAEWTPPFNQNVYEVYSQNLGETQFQSLKKLWRQTLKSFRKKVSTAVDNTRGDLKAARESALFELRGKALFAKLYELGPKSLPKEKEITLAYQEGENEINLLIPLDKTKTYSQNAENYFKKSKKFTRAVGELENMEKELSQKLAQIDLLITKMEEAEDEEALANLEGRLTEFGLAVPSLEQDKSIDKSAAKLFLNIKSSDGFTILCGRNQDENRRVTFEESKGGDVWMHVKGLPGAHVVVISQKNKTVPLSTLLEAAQICLYHSKIRDGRKAEIDYTFRKYVRAIKGTHAEVTYTENKSLFVEANNEKYRKIISGS